MRFENNNQGAVLGFLTAYLVFTSFFYLVSYLLKKNISVIGAIIITLTITLLGLVNKRYLK